MSRMICPQSVPTFFSLVELPPPLTVPGSRARVAAAATPPPSRRGTWPGVQRRGGGPSPAVPGEGTWRAASVATSHLCLRSARRTVARDAPPSPRATMPHARADGPSPSSSAAATAGGPQAAERAPGGDPECRRL